MADDDIREVHGIMAGGIETVVVREDGDHWIRISVGSCWQQIKPVQARYLATKLNHIADRVEARS